MKCLIILIVSFVVLCAYASDNANSSEPSMSSTTSEATSTESSLSSTTSEATSTKSSVSSTTSEAPMCGPNEEYKMCSCLLKDLCLNRFFNWPCLRCTPGCMCCDGYMRRHLGSPCRPKAECDS